MKAKIVTRYNCDFCGRRGFQRPAMARHEAGCTKNINRVCGMCRAAELLVQQPIASLLAALDHGGIDELRALTGGCPACMLSAIHVWRARPTVPGDLLDYNSPVCVTNRALDDFNWIAECKRFWDCFEAEGPYGESQTYCGPENVLPVPLP